MKLTSRRSSGKVRRSISGQHNRSIIVYAPDKRVRNWPTMIGVKLGYRDGDGLKSYQGRPGSVIPVWLPRAKLRQLRDAISRIVDAPSRTLTKVRR